MTLKFFKSPMCGPCKMFQPQLVKATEETGVELITYDVDTPEGADEAAKFNVCSSGVAILLKDDVEVHRWLHPVAALNLVNKIKEFK